MYRFSTKTFVYLALFGLLACGDNDAMPDAGPTPDAPLLPDATLDTDGPTPDGLPPDAMPLPDNIQDALDAPDGAVDVTINYVLVTYTKPTIGTDVAGFFVQVQQIGPALFVAVDPATLTPVPAVGDRVSFSIGEMATAGGLRQATVIGDFQVHSSGNDVSFLVQDVSDALDLVTALDDYTSELVSVTGTITSGFVGAGGGHVKADFDTAVLFSDPDLALRMPTEIADDLGLVIGCSFTTSGTPLWRFFAEAQVHLWMTSEITAATCPAPTVVNAVALSPTEVSVEFNRAIDPASIVDPPNEFTVNNGLAVSDAAVSGRFVTLTTSVQTGGTVYTVRVAGTVTDIFAAGIDPANDTATFTGYQPPATVRINEINANVAGGCDLIEIRVVAGGSMEGFAVTERGAVVYTFPGLVVATNDFVVVHFNGTNGTCNPGASGDETSAKDEFPVATHPANFDFAWDVYSSDAGLTATDNVFEVRAPDMTILDAVLVADDPTGTAAAASETAAAAVAAAGEWTNPDGTTPPGGYIDDDFCANAVQDLNAPDTIQRIDNNDTNNLSDWTMVNAAASWGRSNVGQTDF